MTGIKSPPLCKAINSVDKTTYAHYSDAVACYTAGNFATTPPLYYISLRYSMALIHLKDIHLAFGVAPVLDGIDFSINPDEAKKLKPFNGSSFEPNLFIQLKDNGELVGLKNNKLKDFDNKDLSQELLDYFAPEIKFELFIKTINNFEIGFLYIYKSENKPVITIKTANNNIQEGDIFFRYPGQSRKISYGDLRNIIEEKQNKLNEKWLKLINNVATIGVENIGLLNVENGELIG